MVLSEALFDRFLARDLDRFACFLGWERSAFTALVLASLLATGWLQALFALISLCFIVAAISCMISLDAAISSASAWIAGSGMPEGPLHTMRPGRTDAAERLANARKAWRGHAASSLAQVGFAILALVFKDAASTGGTAAGCAFCLTVACTGGMHVLGTVFQHVWLLRDELAAAKRLVVDALQGAYAETYAAIVGGSASGDTALWNLVEKACSITRRIARALSPWQRCEYASLCGWLPAACFAASRLAAFAASILAVVHPAFGQTAMAAAAAISFGIMAAWSACPLDCGAEYLAWVSGALRQASMKSHAVRLEALAREVEATAVALGEACHVGRKVWQELGGFTALLTLLAFAGATGGGTNDMSTAAGAVQCAAAICVAAAAADRRVIAAIRFSASRVRATTTGLRYLQRAYGIGSPGDGLTELSTARLVQAIAVK